MATLYQSVTHHSERVQHAAVLVDGQVQVLGGTASLGIGHIPAVPHPHCFASTGNRALQFSIEPDAPEGGAPLEQALAFPPAGTIDGRVIDDLRTLNQPRGDLLFRVQTLPDDEAG